MTLDWSTIIVAVIGVCSTFVSWFLARKKYYSEVDHNIIENMESSLEFYKKLSDDNKSRLEEVLTRNAALEKEVADLREQVQQLQAQLFSLMKNKMDRVEGENKKLKKETKKSIIFVTKIVAKLLNMVKILFQTMIFCIMKF